METVFARRFDEKRKFQYINDEPSVLHCHHYITILTKLAGEMEKIDGPRLMYDAMEETFYLVLRKFFISHDVTSQSDKVKVAEDYFSFSGMGILTLNPGKENGAAELKRSHVDEGWIKKWGKAEEPVNYAGCGYIAAVFALLNGLPLRSYNVREVQSIACGASVSKFSITLRKGRS